MPNSDPERDRAAASSGADPDRLTGLLYEELRALAASVFRRSGSSATTLQPTVLVHEAYLKLAADEAAAARSRTHFMAVAAVAMRQVLTDHVRSKQRLKRSAGRERVTLSGLQSPGSEPEVDMESFLKALTRLADEDPRAAQVVELRFLGGLSEREAAERLGVSVRTASNDWAVARAWLNRELERS